MNYKNKKRVYLDYAASTPVIKEVLDSMLPYFTDKFGNPGAIHWFGQEASAAIFNARKIIADAVGADYKQIIFTGSATEANNLVLRGILKKEKQKFIISAIEHDSILKTAKNLEAKGLIELVCLSVDKQGFIDLKELEKSLDNRTTLVSIIYANNEIGTIQPVEKIAKIIKNFREAKAGDRQFPLFHIDAVQAFQFLDCNVNELGVDLMTLSAHKIYGPKGIGALYIKDINKPELEAVITGGGQERGWRSGTENTPVIVGFGKATEITVKLRNKESKRQADLRDYFWKELKKDISRAELNGSDLKKERLPNNLNIYVRGRSSQDLVTELDLAGIAVSPGVACGARTVNPSHVISALGYEGDRPYSSIRISFGRQTTKDEIRFALKKIKFILKA